MTWLKMLIMMRQNKSQPGRQFAATDDDAYDDLGDETRTTSNRHSNRSSGNSRTRHQDQLAPNNDDILSDIIMQRKEEIEDIAQSKELGELSASSSSSSSSSSVRLSSTTTSTKKCQSKIVQTSAELIKSDLHLQNLRRPAQRPPVGACIVSRDILTRSDDMHQHVELLQEQVRLELRLPKLLQQEEAEAEAEREAEAGRKEKTSQEKQQANGAFQRTNKMKKNSGGQHQKYTTWTKGPHKYCRNYADSNNNDNQKQHHQRSSLATASLRILICLFITFTIAQQLCQIIVLAAPRQAFEVQPEARTIAAAGQQVRLPCLVAHRQGRCVWLAPGGEILFATDTRYHFQDNPSDGDCSLVIKAAKVQDDGEWQCQVPPTYVNGTEVAPRLKTRPSRLIVLTPPERPQIKDLAATLSVIELPRDDSSSSSSAEDGRKDPSLRVIQSRLLLSNIKRTLNGKNLTCVGVHQTANQSASVELDVHYVPIASVQQTEVTLVEGSPFSVMCQVDSNPPASSVKWRLVPSTESNDKGRFAAGADREALVTSKSGALLEVAQITRSYNRQAYECLAQNSFGISEPANVRLNILYPPQALNTTQPSHVIAGTSFQLQCAFDGNPQPEIKWHYSDPLSRTHSTLVVDNTRDWDNARDVGSAQSQKEAAAASKPKSLYQQQFLTIRNVSYRNEGDYQCEARNTINGHANLVRSSIMSMDVYGEPQFLVKSPVLAKAVQGSKSEISLTFCSDPQPTKIYWQFGSLRLDVARPGQQQVALVAGAQTNSRPPPPHSAQQQHAHASTVGAHIQQHSQQRFQTHPLQTLQRRDTQYSKVATCFEATLTLLEPELSDQRDYTLFVQNEQGLASGYVRLRVASPLSPALMISSAFVFICALFLCSLIFIFAFKKRQQLMSGASSGRSSSATGLSGATANGNSSGRKRSSRKDKNLLAAATANGNAAADLANGHALKQNGNSTQIASTIAENSNQQQQQQQQTNGIVNGLGHGIANGASNPSSLLSAQQLVVDDHHHHHHHLHQTKGAHGMMSMASSDTSCNDQKQLLASNCSSDRNSSSGGSSNGLGVTVSGSASGDSYSPRHHHHHHHHHQHSGGAMTNSTSDSGSHANSRTPSPMNHISVDDELNLNGTYQATESITNGAQLSPRGAANSASLAHHLNGPSALIYANIDYSTQHNGVGNNKGPQESPSSSSYNNDATTDHIHHHHLHQQQQDLQQDALMTLSRRAASSLASQRLSPDVSEATTAVHQDSTQQQQQQQHNNETGNPTSNRPSVGATIAMMNSLAAAQAAAIGSPTSSIGNGPTTGVLNGAINQQLMANSANRQVRKPGPPKPPKPSIQQRSRFYQQQAAAAAAANGGLVMIGNSQLGQYPTTATTTTPTATAAAAAHEPSSATTTTPTSGSQVSPNHDLAAEYSRLAFPARAEL